MHICRPDEIHLLPREQAAENLPCEVNSLARIWDAAKAPGAWILPSEPEVAGVHDMLAVCTEEFC